MRFFFYYPTWDKPSGSNMQLRLIAALLPELCVENSHVRYRRFYAPGAGSGGNVFFGLPVPFASVRGCLYMPPGKAVADRTVARTITL
jgi:hypothetical protein